MNTIDCIKNRRSIRKFKAQPIPHQTIEEIVELASYSPSWKNTQIARYIYIEDQAIIHQISEKMILNFDFNKDTLNNCPAIVLVTYITSRSGFERDGTFSTPKGNGFEMFDAGIATQTFCLAAYEKGIGTVITGYFDEEKISELLHLPENQKIASLICLGYPDETPEMPRRKSVSELLTFYKQE